MKRLVKIDQTLFPAFEFSEEKFSEGVTVQGGIRRAFENALLIESGGRFKLFSEGKDYLRILEGDGHFKWSRGEPPFRAGECFLAEEAGEYEVNGKCRFLVLRK